MAQRENGRNAATGNATATANAAQQPAVPQPPAPQLPNLPDPTTTVGDPFNPPIPISHEAIAAARQVAFSSAATINGFTNRNNNCYRIAVLTILMNCSRLMSWIDNRLLPQLDNLSLALRPIPTNLTTAQMIRYQGAAARPYRYSNFLLELHALWKLSSIRSAQHVLDAVFKNFTLWTNSMSWNVTGQQDADEYLRHLLVGAATELQATDGVTDPATGAPITTSSDRILQGALAEFDNMTELVSTIRGRCVVCRSTHNVMIRNGLDRTRIWQFSIPPAATASDGSAAQAVTLEQCIAAIRKQERDGWSCDACNTQRQATNAQRLATATANGTADQLRATINQETNRRLAIPDYQWRYVRDLPEILFMSIGRFTPMRTKDNTVVTIPQDIDLASSLDPDLPSTTVTQYRLSGVVSHAGDMDQGHYVAYTRSEDQWYKVDDHQVTQVQFDIIHTDQWITKNGNYIFTPYLLLWEKVPPPAPASGPASTNTAMAGAASAAASSNATANTAPATIAAGVDQPTSTLPAAGKVWFDLIAIANGTTIAFPRQTVNVPPAGQNPRMDLQCQMTDEHGASLNILQASSMGMVRLGDGNQSLLIRYNPVNNRPAAPAAHPAAGSATSNTQAAVPDGSARPADATAAAGTQTTPAAPIGQAADGTAPAANQTMTPAAPADQTADDSATAATGPNTRPADGTDTTGPQTTTAAPTGLSADAIAVAGNQAPTTTTGAGADPPAQATDNSTPAGTQTTATATAPNAQTANRTNAPATQSATPTTSPTTAPTSQPATQRTGPAAGTRSRRRAATQDPDGTATNTPQNNNGQSGRRLRPRRGAGSRP